MDLAQLHMVKQILATGSLSKTATRLDWAQSVVSRQLTALERECGGRIFYRNGRGVVLTELGERILPQIDRIIAAADEIVGCGEKLRNEVAGDVRIAVSPQVLPYLSGPLFCKLAEEYPSIRLSVWEAFTGQVRTDLREGRFDVGVCMVNAADVCPDDRIICELEGHLVGLPDSPATRGETIPFSQLENLPLLLPSSSSVWRQSLDQIAAGKGMSLSVAAEVNAPGPLATLVQEGAGYMISPLASGAPAARMGGIGADVHTGRLRAARIVDPAVPVKLVIRTGPNRYRRIESVVRLIEAILAELLIPDPDNDMGAPAPRAAIGSERREPA